MYQHAHDRADAAYVARFAPGGEPQADFVSHVESLRPALEQARADGKTLALLVVFEAGHEPPDVRSRAMLGQFQADAVFAPDLVVVARNPQIRGTLTALDWLRGKRLSVQTAADTREGIALLERGRGVAIDGLHRAAGRIQ